MNKKIIILVIAFLLLVMVLTLSEDLWLVGNRGATHKYSWVVEYVQPDDSVIGFRTASILSYNYNGKLTSQDVYKLQDWVATNIDYVNENPEYPNQTLQDRDGDCFNMCSLLYSMILNEDEDANSYMLLIDIKVEGESFIRKHSAVLSIFNSEIIISDPTLGNDIGRFCILDSPEDALDTIIEGTICDWYLITTAVSLNDYKEFTNEYDFVTWIEGG